MSPRICWFSSQFAALAAALGLAFATATAQDISAPPDTEGIEVLTRGVVHEAFAEVAADPKPGLVVAKKPPEPIEEVPAEYKPEDDAAIWISGYWVWDDEREDFFWQSGVWRVPPPGMRWVAGYWNEVGGGWQWVSGFWVSVETPEVRYYDPPPASLEVGPSSPSPGDDYFWATGSWNYHDTGYRWQPGYWAPYRSDWVWCSPRYVWSPAGCVYVPGYWDYRLTRRGCLFAPVYFQRPIYTQPNFVYRPWCALNTPNLFLHMWVRPNYNHFYFGNYYGSGYNSWGFTPWCHYRPYRGCYDPLLTQLNCHYRRQGVNYIGRLDGWHRHYNGNVGARPPRTWNEQVRLTSNNTNITNVNVKQNVLAVNLRDNARRNELPVKLARLDGDSQKRAELVARESRDLRKQRIEVERPVGIDPRRERGNDLTNSKRERGDIASPTRERGNDSTNPTRERGNREAVKLQLPATQTERVAKERVKLAPPKLSQSRVGSPDGQKNRRPEVSGPVARPERTKAAAQPRSETPRPQPRVESPRPQTRIDDPRRQPKIEAPLARPKIESPRPEPNIRTPRPNLERPSVPRPEARPERSNSRSERSFPPVRIETPRERPQPKVELPRPAPRIESAPRIQPAPRSQPEIRIQRSEPRPQAAPRVQSAPRSAPRVEVQRPQPTMRQPSAPRVQNSAPRVQSSAPRVQRSDPAPRRESAPRPQSSSRSENRGRGRDK